MFERKNIAIFSCMGLGDGLIAMVLANNLVAAGAAVTLFHPFLASLQRWFPKVKISSFPSIEKTGEILASFDYFFILFEKSTWMQNVMSECVKNYKSRTYIINPIATTNTDYPYWETAKFTGDLTFVQNLENFSRDILHLPGAAKGNGIVVPKELQKHRYSKRVVIHPTSSREGKNWPKEKYLSLAKLLQRQGYEPVFIFTKEEKKQWQDEKSPDFTSLDEMTAYVAESGYMIGNDSGIGHLASCLDVPTLIICRSKKNANFWKPGWAKGVVVTPSSLIPNFKMLRFRDKYWKKWVSISKVFRAFGKLISN